MSIKSWLAERLKPFSSQSMVVNPHPALVEAKKELEHQEAKLDDIHENLVDTIQHLRQPDYLKGRVVSPEIDQLKNKFAGMSASTMSENLGEDPALATEVLLKRLDARQSGKIELPEGMDVERSLIDSGHYKLGTGPHHVTQASRRLPEAVLFKIQNVRDYYMQHWEAHRWHEVRSFCAVRLQFDKIVMTYEHKFNNPDTGQVIERHVNVGMAKCSREAFITKLGPANMSPQDTADVIHCLHTLDPDSLIETRIAVDGMSLPGSWYVMIDKMGQVLTEEASHTGWVWIRDGAETEMLRIADLKLPDAMESTVCRHGCIGLAAVQFMNCRNVEILDNPPTRQQRRQAQREGRPPAVTYKTLVIHPMGQKRRVVRQADGSAAAGVSLHIVRGHLKSYVEGKGLGRGHVHGVFWWSPQVRGSADRGRVVKDYDVLAEEDA